MLHNYFKLTGDTQWAYDAMAAVIKTCLTEVSYNNTLEDEKTADETAGGNSGDSQPISIAEAVRENVCLNDCSNSGDCVNGILLSSFYNLKNIIFHERREIFRKCSITCSEHVSKSGVIPFQG